MKKFLLLQAVLLLINITVRAQDSALMPGKNGVVKGHDSLTILRNYTFDSVTPNGSVAEMSATHDSLLVTFSKGELISGQDRYKILSKESRSPYRIIYVKMDPSSLTKLKPADAQSDRVPLYGVFVFHFEKENGKLMILHDGRLWPTKNDAREAYAKIWLPDEYYNTWYNSIRFANFLKYPDFVNANKLTVERVIIYWFRKIIEHSKHKLNTINEDEAGSDYGRDNFTKVLVNYRINPMATSADLIYKIKQYHLVPDKKDLEKSGKPQHAENGV